MATQKIVLAYSGGLDTSVAIPWLKEKYGGDVVAVAVDIGQGRDFASVKEKALAIGAAQAIIVDAKEEFARDFVLPALFSNAMYEGKYPLVSALSRPLISKWLVEAAENQGAGAVAHGCTGKGNDQVRFETALAALSPDLEVLAPIRDWGMSREESVEYARARNIPVPATAATPYSIDDNLWGKAIECGPLEDPYVEPPEEVFTLTTSPEDAPDEPEYLEIAFEAGVPVSANGGRMDLSELIDAVGGIAGRHGFGRMDMVENRLVGIKSREVYECPSALTLIMAHRELESLTLDRELLHYKAALEMKVAEIIYFGLWFSPLRESLDAFMAETQKPVTGTVRLKLFKGGCRVVGRKSDEALYDYSLATYDEGDKFTHGSAKGFIDLWSLPTRVWARKHPRS